ncbi:MAG: hypothetical protein KAI24_00725 [Planctomycetes bacterium]|nr:hypothetical protein [Planctomycetota bacterium]
MTHDTGEPLAYERCLDGSCQRSGCAQCDPERALRQFLAAVGEGRSAPLRALPAQPVLIYHVPRSGGTFLAEVFERLGVLVARPDYPADAEVVDDLLRRGQRRGVLIMAHTAAAVKARHPEVGFVEFAACWRDPFEICASEFHGIRNARPGHHLFDHHLRAACLGCDSVADWVERHGRGDPVTKVLAGNRPTLLSASRYQHDVGGMLEQLLGVRPDLVGDFGFDPDSLRPGRWLAGASREQLLRLRACNQADYRLLAELAPVARP